MIAATFHIRDDGLNHILTHRVSRHRKTAAKVKPVTIDVILVIGLQDRSSFRISRFQEKWKTELNRRLGLEFE